MASLKNDSTSNIARRYRHLFRLPSTFRSVLFASVPAILTVLISRSVTGTTLLGVLLYAIATEILLLISIEIDYLALAKRSKVSTFRRLAAISIISNSLWFILSIVAIVVFLLSGSEARFVGLVALGTFLAISFRAFVFGSVFYERPIQGLPLAVVQPVLLAFPIFISLDLLTQFSIPILTCMVGGVLAVIAMEVYLASVNKSANFAEFKPFQILQAFLKAWTVEDATIMERFLDSVSRETIVKTTMITLENASSSMSSAMIVVPGIHPGPFYPIGSSNLPADIYLRLKTDRIIPLTVHSISDHDLNLPSKSQVERYVSSLREAKDINDGQTMTIPLVKAHNKATVTCIGFGSVALIALTQAPYGMEDFPVSVRKSIEEFASLNGFKSAFVIDTHNSEGAKPNEQECEDMVRAAKDALNEVKSAEQKSFKMGFAHSSELVQISTPNDVGPAGVGLLLFETGGSTFSFVVVDANNSKLGFRETVFQLFERKTGSKIIEMCTSDTHVTAARTMGAKGYLALGDLVPAEDFASLLSSLYEKAKDRIGTGRFSTKEVTSQVKTIGGEILNEFSGLLDNTLSTAKRGAQFLGIMIIAIALVVAII